MIKCMLYVYNEGKTGSGTNVSTQVLTEELKTSFSLLGPGVKPWPLPHWFYNSVYYLHCVVLSLTQGTVLANQPQTPVCVCVCVCACACVCLCLSTGVFL